MRPKITPLTSALLLAALTFVLRYYILGPETGDIDEATFTVVAQSVLRGALPYELALDNKPAGFFYVLAGAMGIFGQSNTVVRLLGSVAIFATGVTVMSICRRYLSLGAATALAALFIAAQTDGIANSTKSELIANLFIMLSLLVMLRWPNRNGASFAAGALVSAGVLCRTNLAYLALALAAIHFAALAWPARLGLKRSSIVALGLGGLIPVAALLVPYALEGQLRLLWVAMVEVPLSQATSADGGLIGRLTMIPFSFVRILPGVAGVLLVVSFIGIWHLCRTIRSRPEMTRATWLVALYVVAIEFSILMSGIFYNHYMLQVLGPLLVLGAIGLAGSEWDWRRWWARFTAFGVAAAILFFVPQGVFLAWRQATGQVSRPLQAAAAAMLPDLRSEDRVWALSYTQLILVYLNKDPILPVAAFPSNLTKAVIVEPLVRAGFMPVDGAHAALALRPRYVVNGRQEPPPHLSEADLAEFERLYELWLSGDGVFVYRLIETGGST